MRLHFISGLPRSGSTLLATILKQNAEVCGAMSSALSDIFTGALQVMSFSEKSLFISDQQRRRILRAVVEAYYCDSPHGVIYDTSRLWCALAAPLFELFPSSWMICCVRNPAWILDSIEHLVQRNSMLVSKLFPPEVTNVYSRAEILMKGGMVGGSLQALRQAWFSNYAGRLVAVQYESLAERPGEVLAALYNIIGEQPYTHRFDDLEYDELEFDMRLNMPGLHRVSREVAFTKRETILPPDLFKQFDNSFWNQAGQNPRGVTVL
jgi:sulfotransferase